MSLSSFISPLIIQIEVQYRQSKKIINDERGHLSSGSMYIERDWVLSKLFWQSSRLGLSRNVSPEDCLYSLEIVLQEGLDQIVSDGLHTFKDVREPIKSWPDPIFPFFLTRTSSTFYSARSRLYFWVLKRQIILKKRIIIHLLFDGFKIQFHKKSIAISQYVFILNI